MPLFTSPTPGLSLAFLRELRLFLDAAFDGQFSDDDWVHGLGGTHVWVSGPEGIVSYAALVERTLECSGRRVRAAYVEAMATAAARRGEGHGTAVVRKINELIVERHALGALSTGVDRFYERCGWERWRGPTFVDGPHGRERTPDDDGGIMVLRTPRSPSLDPDGSIVCDWRAGDVW